MSDTIIKDLLASKIEDYKSGRLNFREFHLKQDIVTITQLCIRTKLALDNTILRMLKRLRKIKEMLIYL